MGIGKGRVFFYTCIAIIAISNIIGCAKNSTDVKNNDIKSPVPITPRKNSYNLPEKTTPLKELPEMNAEDYERSGDANFNSGNMQMAMVQYQKSLRQSPGNSRIHYKIGLLFLAAHMNEDAAKEFQELIKKELNNALAYEGLGLALLSMQKNDEAEKTFDKAVTLNPALWRSHNSLGIIYDFKKVYKKAVPAYKKAISLKADNALLYNNLGLSYSLSGDYENAINTFKKALGITPVPSKVYNNFGLALAMSGRYAEALEAFNKGGNEAQAYNNLGCAYLLNGEDEKARRAFDTAIKLNPTFYEKANDNMKKAKAAGSGYYINELQLQDVITQPPQPEDKAPATVAPIKAVEPRAEQVTGVAAAKPADKAPAATPSINRENSSSTGNVSQPEAPRFHIVKQGDTIWKISKKYNISKIKLQQLNNLPPDLKIKINMKLKLY